MGSEWFAEREERERLLVEPPCFPFIGVLPRELSGETVTASAAVLTVTDVLTPETAGGVGKRPMETARRPWSAVTEAKRTLLVGRDAMN